MVSRVVICLWFLKTFLKLLKRNDFSWGYPFQCFMFSVSPIFPCMILSIGCDQSNGEKSLWSHQVPPMLCFSLLTVTVLGMQTGWSKMISWSAARCAAAWVFKHSKAHCNSSLCSFLLTLVTVFCMRKSKRTPAPGNQHQYNSTETMAFCSSLYSFNASKQWPTLVTCHHGMFTKPLHVGDCLLQTLHSYWI